MLQGLCCQKVGEYCFDVAVTKLVIILRIIPTFSLNSTKLSTTVFASLLTCQQMSKVKVNVYMVIWIRSCRLEERYLSVL